MAQKITADDLARELEVDPSSLKNEISEPHRLDIADFIDWKTVGPRLEGITIDDTKDIEKEGCDQLDKKRELIDKWWQRNGSCATYHAMITAMLTVGRRADAEKVCKFLFIATTPSQETTAIPDHITCETGKVPTMPLLMKVELPSQVRKRVDEFGTFLLQDDKGEKMAAIRIECGDDKQKMVMEILREWLAGNGAEVSWKSLRSVLMNSKLPILAEQVQTLDPENSDTQLVDPDSAMFCSETIVGVYTECSHAHTYNTTYSYPYTYSLTHSHLYTLTHSHLYTLTHSFSRSLPVTDERPSLRQLIRLNLPFRVGEDADRLGFELLENYDFMDSKEDPEKRAMLIFRDWVAGKGEMVTWEVLISALKGCKLSTLSEEVQIALEKFQHA